MRKIEKWESEEKYKRTGIGNTISLALAVKVAHLKIAN
jgi:hypothetical protein